MCARVLAQVTHWWDLWGRITERRRDWVHESESERCVNWFWVTIWTRDFRQDSPPACNEDSSGRGNHRNDFCQASGHRHGNLWALLRSQRLWVSQLQLRNMRRIPEMAKMLLIDSKSGYCVLNLDFHSQCLKMIVKPNNFFGTWYVSLGMSFKLKIVIKCLERFNSRKYLFTIFFYVSINTNFGEYNPQVWPLRTLPV